MELFVAIRNRWKLLTFVTENPFFNVARLLELFYLILNSVFIGILENVYLKALKTLHLESKREKQG